MIIISIETMTDRHEIANLLQSDKGNTVYISKKALANKILDEAIQGIVSRITKDDGNTFTAGFMLYDVKTQSILEGFTFVEGQGHNLFTHFVNHLLISNNWKVINYQLNENNIKMERFFKAAIENLSSL